MAQPKVYADFQNADSQGRVRLNCVGTINDLSAQHVELQDGLLLTLYSDDADDNGQSDELLVDGVEQPLVTHRADDAQVPLGVVGAGQHPVVDADVVEEAGKRP